jgi:SET domain
MTISQIASLGLIAAILQVAGYAVYIRNFRREAIKPNAASFFMFAYGTSLLTFLEWESGAGWALLALPLACAIFGVVVALMCLRQGATEPVDRFEMRAFWIDVWLTLFYLYFALAEGDGTRFALPFLIATNLSALVCFAPILRSTWQNPTRELAGPWLLWTAAYTMLAMATIVAEGLSKPVLLLYPLLNLVLHGAMVILIARAPLTRALYRYIHPSLRIAPSMINGFGLFAQRSYGIGDRLCRLSGAIKQRPQRSLPNWIGLAPGLWIDPNTPLQHINHSCDANSAFGPRRQLMALRPIAKGEEITLDYSTTESDPYWSMACACGTAQCRKMLFAIQFSFPGQEPPPASPLMQRIWRNWHDKAARDASAFAHITSDSGQTAQTSIVDAA